MSLDRPRPDRRRRAADGGFTLVEALVALAMLAAVSPALFRMAVMLRTGTEAIDDRTRSEIVARSLLDAALTRHDLAQYSLSGITDGRRWSVEGRPLDVDVRRAIAASGWRSGDDRPPRQDEARKPDPKADREPDKPGEDVSWMPVSVTIRVETTGQPLRIETISLARKIAP